MHGHHQGRARRSRHFQTVGSTVGSSGHLDWPKNMSTFSRVGTYLQTPITFWSLGRYLVISRPERNCRSLPNADSAYSFRGPRRRHQSGMEWDRAVCLLALPSPARCWELRPLRLLASQWDIASETRTAKEKKIYADISTARCTHIALTLLVAPATVTLLNW